MRHFCSAPILIIPCCFLQALILAFAAEKSFSMSDVDDLLALCKEVSTDKKALDSLQLSRGSATYKLVHGLGKTLKETTLAILRTQPFSLNIDESTSNADNRVLAIMVNYFNPTLNKMVVEHLAAFELVKVNTASIFAALVDMFNTYNLSWKLVISILMDSCAVMRGSKQGLETRIRRDLAPHLLDVDGDECHHVHNASKRLCGPFDQWTEKLANDLHNDHKWSVDLREWLADVCAAIGVKFTMPERHISHRWLSAYDRSLDVLRMWDCYKLFYYGFLTPSDRATYEDVMSDILRRRNVGAQQKAVIQKIWRDLRDKKKTLTEDGKKRKERIYEKVLFHEKKTLLVLNYYKAVLPLLKSYVCLFQSSEPLIHKLNDKQEELLRQFLSNFVYPEKILSGAKLATQELAKDMGQFMNRTAMFCGGEFSICFNNFKDVYSKHIKLCQRFN